MTDVKDSRAAQSARNRIVGLWFPLVTACVAWGTAVLGWTLPDARSILYSAPFTYGACVVGLNLGILKKGPWWVIVANGLFLIAGVPLVVFVVFVWAAQASM